MRIMITTSCSTVSRRRWRPTPKNRKKLHKSRASYRWRNSSLLPKHLGKTSRQSALRLKEKNSMSLISINLSSILRVTSVVKATWSFKASIKTSISLESINFMSMRTSGAWIVNVSTLKWQKIITLVYRSLNVLTVKLQGQCKASRKVIMLSSVERERRRRTKSHETLLKTEFILTFF